MESLSWREQVCGSSSWIIPLGLALPYFFRLCQCIRVYRDTGVRANVSPIPCPFQLALPFMLTLYNKSSLWCTL
jgi:hypothetical protein